MTRARDLADSADKDITGTLTVDGISSSGDITLADNDKAIFGAGSDLQIYHDGSHSYIDEAGTGDIYVSVLDDVIFRTYGTNELVARFNTNQSTGGWARLYHRGSQRLETTATGVDVSSTDATVNFVSSRGTGATHTITTGGANSLNFNINAASGGDIYVNAENKIFRNAAGSTEHMRIDSSGNVGIGTVPSDILHIRNSAATNVLIDAPTDNASLTLQCGSSDAGAESAFVQFIQNTTPKWQLGVNTDNTFRLYNYNLTSEALQVDSGGTLATAAASGNNVLELSSQGSATNTRFVRFNINGSTTSGTEVGSIQYNGTGTSYITSSDYRLKTGVTYDWDATSRLKQLKPARFNFITAPDITVDGFLAHEVQDIVPEAISGTKDAMRDEEYTVSAATGDIYTPAVAATYDEDGVELTAAVDEVIHSADVERPEELAEGQQWRETTAAVMGTRSVPDYQGIDQSKLTPLLTKALIEAVEKIEQLEARITALEAN